MAKYQILSLKFTYDKTIVDKQETVVADNHLNAIKKIYSSGMKITEVPQENMANLIVKGARTTKYFYCQDTPDYNKYLNAKCLCKCGWKGKVSDLLPDTVGGFTPRGINEHVFCPSCGDESDITPSIDYLWAAC